MQTECVGPSRKELHRRDMKRSKKRVETYPTWSTDGWWLLIHEESELVKLETPRLSYAMKTLDLLRSWDCTEHAQASAHLQIAQIEVQNQR